MDNNGSDMKKNPKHSNFYQRKESLILKKRMVSSKFLMIKEGLRSIEKNSFQFLTDT